MKFQYRFALATLFAVLLGITASVGVAVAANPTPEQALKLAPTQEGVDYDRPTPEEAARCKIAAKKSAGQVGWVVESPEGVILRKFVDTNGDNVVDQWSYYKEGVEVYRDIDSKFNGKVDQCRWLNSGGTRWGIGRPDARGGGTTKIDHWKVISPEEVTSEVVAALAKQDAERFSRLLLSGEELQTIGLGRAKAELIAAKIARAEEDFRRLLGHQNSITADTRWVQFGGVKPGTVPAAADGPAQDLNVYENVFAVVQTGGKAGQVQIGTLIRVGDAWRLIDAPTISDGQPETPQPGFIAQTSGGSRSSSSATGPSEESQKLLSDLEKLDQFSPRRPDLLEQIAELAKTPEERSMWYRQVADTVSAAVQSGKSPEGDKRLEALFRKLQKNEADKALVPYVRFRQLTAQYGLSMQAPGADFAKIQAEWLKILEQYITDFPTSSDAAEAMLQLGIAREFAGQEDAAKKWYARIVQDFPGSPAARKASGATVRLDSVGNSLTFSGKGISGDTVDLAKFRGKVVLIQYWATWCGPCKADMPALKELMTKYAGNFTVLGVSLDNNAKDLSSYLAENRLPWPQVFEEGGLDSRPANFLGILTLPTMILVDQDGKVVNRNIQTADIEGELKKLIR